LGNNAQEFNYRNLSSYQLDLLIKGRHIAFDIPKEGDTDNILAKPSA